MLRFPVLFAYVCCCVFVFFCGFSEHLVASVLVTFGSFGDSILELLDVRFFDVFSSVWKKVPLKRLFAYFLVLADPREPQYSLGQTQFCADQR